MFKKITLIIIAGLFAFGLSGLSFAMSCGDHGDNNSQPSKADAGYQPGTTAAVQQAVSKDAVNVGNIICPVTGEKIVEKDKATYEYEGKIYNFCCPMCIDEFKKDPQKYIQKVNAELNASSNAQPQAN